MVGKDLALVTESGRVLAAPTEAPTRWRTARAPTVTNAGQISVTGRGDLWFVSTETVDVVMRDTGAALGQLADRPCESVHPLPGEDIIVIYDDSIVRYRLGGHLSVVPDPDD